MNARANLITATLTLALIIPAAASAGARNIPADASLPKKQPAPRLNTLQANTAAISANTYNTWGAYVHGGASPKVAKAITDANSRTTNALGTYSNWGAYVHGGASPKVAKAITDANSRTTNALGTYSNWGAYVHGGSSQKVAKAITDASTRTASTCLSDAQHRVPC